MCSRSSNDARDWRGTRVGGVFYRRARGGCGGGCGGGAHFDLPVTVWNFWMNEPKPLRCVWMFLVAGSANGKGAISARRQQRALHRRVHASGGGGDGGGEGAGSSRLPMHTARLAHAHAPPQRATADWSKVGAHTPRAQLEPGESGLAFLPTTGLVGDARAAVPWLLRGGRRAMTTSEAATFGRASCCIEVGGTNAEARLHEGPGRTRGGGSKSGYTCAARAAPSRPLSVRRGKRAAAQAGGCARCAWYTRARGDANAFGAHPTARASNIMTA